jgi:hypothetical protein
VKNLGSIYKHSRLFGFLLIAFLFFNFTNEGLAQKPAKISLPPSGYLYHGVYPGPEDLSGEENLITLKSLKLYETAVGKKAAWVYFSHEWSQGEDFPIDTISWIQEHGSIPFIRLMLRYKPQQNIKERVYTLDKIIQGNFDETLRAWAIAAHNYHNPLIVEYGTEVNGEWFPWNARWYGKRKGTEKFKQAYRHIIDVMRDENANNITWVFHVNNLDLPDEEWNRLEKYYPGNDYIDWIGVSIYGAQTPLSDDWPIFREALDAVYPRLVELAPDKPIVILEFAMTSGHPHGNQAQWAKDALENLGLNRWPEVIGFSWWNEAWENDDDPNHNTNMRVQENVELSKIFQKYVGENDQVLDELILEHH